ncbi:hypothetical protein [Xanthomonas arboricola]|uniref:hypothetical protein n=1 Tax=Xanthomonas arboricola TaxID=56448 RepID=UPI001AF5A384|nr:hypothetical protein [Xanthomonas arboricola]CAD7387232.1 hypothetical protein X12_004212 [Xanthomonas arboricola]CAG2098145.1 hypothetical protein XCY_004216 [Xanthomonas arboricola pv. juglandis]
MIDYDKFIEGTISEVTPNIFLRTVEVGVVSADSSKKYRVNFENVFDMVVDGMRLNNTVDEFLLHENFNDGDVLSKLKFLLIGDHSEYIEGVNSHVDIRVADLKSGKLKLWEFSPNYGALILILSERCSVTVIS